MILVLVTYGCVLSRMDFYCSICNQEYCSPSRRRLHHARRHAGTPFQPISEVEYRSRGEIATSKKYCTLCDTVFMSDFTRNRHVQTVHGKREKRKRALSDIQSNRDVKQEKAAPATSPINYIYPGKNENPILYVRVFDSEDPNKIKYDICIPPSTI